jgi:MYXO-CTERM domain-containing protein
MRRQLAWASWAPWGACCLGLIPPSSSGNAEDVARRTEVSDSSLAFEANLGQFEPEVQFAARGAGYALWLTGGGATLSLANDLVLGLSVRGKAAALVPSQRLVARASYFRGNDPSTWVTGAPRFASVAYVGAGSGIDLVYRGDEGRLEYDFIVASGASVDDAVLDVTGADGLSVDSDGALLLGTRQGVLRQLPPVVYQDGLDGSRQRIAGAYRILDATRVAFTVGAYDPSRRLVIDPVLLYGTYLGGSSFDQANAVALDASGDVYVAGFTSSPNFPTTRGAAQGKIGGSIDAFVAELDPTGKTLLYATYLGGMLEDSAKAIAVDASGNAFITGQTQSTDFPTAGRPYQPANAGAGNAFVAKLARNGESLVYSTYLGGMGFDSAAAIALDSLGDAYVAGYTQSPDFPTMNPFESSLMGAQNAFLAELSPDGSSLLAGTYFGGEVDDAANALTLDASGDVWVAGYTQSTWQSSDFPNKHPFQENLAGPQNAFVAEFSAGVGALDAMTLLGGSVQDSANALAVDATGNVYLAGATSSPDFPTAEAFHATLEGSEDAFVTKLSNDLSSLVYSTFLGGSGDDVGAALGVAPSGEAFVAGQTGSSNFPLVGAFQTSNEAASSPQGNAFLSIFEASGRRLAGSTYLGGTGGASAHALALTGTSTVWVAGTAGSDLPVPGALFPAFAAQGPTGENAFVALLSPEAGVATDAGPPDAPDDASQEASAPPLGDGGGVGVIGPSYVPENTTGCGCRTSPKKDSSLPSLMGFGALALIVFRRTRRLSLTGIESDIQ